MHRSTLLVFAAMLMGAVYVQAQGGLQQTIITPDKAVPVVNQTLSGTWLSELRRPSATGMLPPIPAIVTFSADGGWISSPSDGSQTATQGLWIRVGDRKFLGSGFFFAFNENRVLTTIAKLRINYQVSEDGKTLKGTTEAVIFSPDGTTLNTLAGATFTMVRLSPEIPSDFYEFQKQ
jgi:hypothetical protein